MSSWSSEHIFEHPWEDVVRAAYRKYPNPCNPAVKGVDVVNRSVCPQGTIQSHRLLSTEFPLPEVAARIIGTPEKNFISEHSTLNARNKMFKLESRNLLGANDHAMHISEHSKLDRSKSKYELQSKNLTLGHLVTVHERMEYFPHPQDRSKTCLKQQSTVKVNVPFLSGYLERLLIENFEKNAMKGRNGMEWVIDRIKEEDSSNKVKQSSDILTQLETKFKREAEDLKQSMDSFFHKTQANTSPL
ncbi:PRELI domain containing protein 3A-like isoform X3 [Crassostrea angulata]|uniref:Slowmo-like protein 2 n=1 Tax=Magallana gigas TaxID=29159 RepID=K1QTU2_MAGGI|nr:PRELI domain containing protein 3A-like isoform X3 [Crassostrea angulata]|eukprot:XP_019924292.1 PREDICTED: PRELI domain containing protein 3A isoform X1 [Crassostrea gigas]